MESNIPVSDVNTRKRKGDPQKWKRNVQKRQRYSAKGLPEYPTCNHRVGYQCSLLTMRDVRDFHTSFYSIPEKNKQDAFILKYCRTQPPNPKRKKREPRKGKTAIFQYTIVNQAGNNLIVCRDAFLKVLQPITKHRIIGVFKRFNTGVSHVPVETRGGNHKEAKFTPKREAVKNFICSFKAIESHYSRHHSSRVYLPSELNIAKLWKMFNNGKDESEMVTQAFFRKIFCTNFNIGFSCPSMDECSTCIELKNRIGMETSEPEKKSLQLKMQLHKRQAQAFFEHLREKPPGCFLLSFDCQKNLVLPKVTDQSAYYSRQIYCYNLSVIKGLSTEFLNLSTVSIYSWTEDEAKKSSNEVASIVFNEMNSAALSEYDSIRLVADGCAGQNKNVNILTMCQMFLASCAPANIKKIEIVFPVTGHSFLPSDRVFGLIERALKKINTIVNKEEYHEVFKTFGTLKLIGIDWIPLDWKEEARKFVKTASQLHFKISTCRRVVLRKTKLGNVVVKGEMAYNIDTGAERKICKANCNAKQINPKKIPIGVQLKKEKVKDVEKLIEKHFGENWKDNTSLEWYKNLINSTPSDLQNDSNLAKIDKSCECENGDDFDDDII